MNKKMKLGISMLFLLFIVEIVYIFLHEAGHAIVALSCGAGIRRFSLLSAHVNWTGGKFTPFTHSLANIAGMLLPVFAALMSLCFYRKNRQGILYHLAFFMFSIACAGSALVWVVFPVMSFWVKLPEGEDVTKFMLSSGLHPLATVLIGLTVIGSIIFLAWKRKLPQTVWTKLKNIRNNSQETETQCPSGRQTFLLGVIAVAAFILVLICEVLPDARGPIFELKRTEALTEANLVTAYGFTVPDSRTYDIDIQLKAKGLLADICMMNEAGEIVYRSYFDEVSQMMLWLEEGKHTVKVTYLPDKERFEEYYKEKEYNLDSEAVKELEQNYEEEAGIPELSVYIK